MGCKRKQRAAGVNGFLVSRFASAFLSAASTLPFSLSPSFVISSVGQPLGNKGPHLDSANDLQGVERIALCLQ